MRSTTLKIAVQAPMPSASARSAATVKLRFRSRSRAAYRRSRTKAPSEMTHKPIETGRGRKFLPHFFTLWNCWTAKWRPVRSQDADFGQRWAGDLDLPAVDKRYPNVCPDYGRMTRATLPLPN